MVMNMRTEQKSAEDWNYSVHSHLVYALMVMVILQQTAAKAKTRKI